MQGDGGLAAWASSSLWTAGNHIAYANLLSTLSRATLDVDFVELLPKGGRAVFHPLPPLPRLKRTDCFEEIGEAV